MSISIKTYRAEEPGPHQWIAVLEARAPSTRDDKPSGLVCMNFWGGTEFGARRAAEAWFESELGRLRKLENARLGPRRAIERAIEEGGE